MWGTSIHEQRATVPRGPTVRWAPTCAALTPLVAREVINIPIRILLIILYNTPAYIIIIIIIHALLLLLLDSDAARPEQLIKPMSGFRPIKYNIESEIIVYLTKNR